MKYKNIGFLLSVSVPCLLTTLPVGLGMPTLPVIPYESSYKSLRPLYISDESSYKSLQTSLRPQHISVERDQKPLQLQLPNFQETIMARQKRINKDLMQASKGDIMYLLTTISGHLGQMSLDHC